MIFINFFDSFVLFFFFFSFPLIFDTQSIRRLTINDKGRKYSCELTFLFRAKMKRKMWIGEKQVKFFILILDRERKTLFIFQ